MSIARHHAEWLSLLEISGPFLSMPVLMEAFPPQHRQMIWIRRAALIGSAGLLLVVVLVLLVVLSFFGGY